MGDYNASFWGPEQNKIEKLRKQSTFTGGTQTKNSAKFETVHANWYLQKDTPKYFNFMKIVLSNA